MDDPSADNRRRARCLPKERPNGLRFGSPALNLASDVVHAPPGVDEVRIHACDLNGLREQVPGDRLLNENDGMERL